MALGLTAPAAAENILVGVNGLVCAFCVHGIEATFKEQPQVETVKVDLDEKTVAVVTKAKMTLDDAAIEHLITEAGYTPIKICRTKDAGRAAPTESECKQLKTASSTQ